MLVDLQCKASGYRGFLALLESTMYFSRAGILERDTTCTISNQIMVNNQYDGMSFVTILHAVKS